MDTLFPVLPITPAGFQYFPDFISSEEEMKLVSDIQNFDLHPFQFHGYEAKRKVASFGYDYSFENKSLSRGTDIPKQFSPIMRRVEDFLGLPHNSFAELLLTQYPVGAVINWHRDAFPFEIIAGLSLNSDCTFRLRPHDRSKQQRTAILSIPLKRKSLYVMQGTSRTQWEHSIPAVQTIRYSITLRTLKHSQHKQA